MKMSFPGTKSAIASFLPFAAQKAQWCGSRLPPYFPKLPTPKGCVFGTGLFSAIYLLNTCYRPDTVSNPDVLTLNTVHRIAIAS